MIIPFIHGEMKTWITSSMYTAWIWSHNMTTCTTCQTTSASEVALAMIFSLLFSSFLFSAAVCLFLRLWWCETHPRYIHWTWKKNSKSSCKGESTRWELALRCNSSFAVIIVEHINMMQKRKETVNVERRVKKQMERKRLRGLQQSYSAL